MSGEQRARDRARLLGRRRASRAATLDRTCAAIVLAADQQPATEREQRFIWAVGREAGLDEAGVEALCRRVVGMGLAELRRHQAALMIEVIRAMRDGRPPA